MLNAGDTGCVFIAGLVICFKAAQGFVPGGAIVASCSSQDVWQYFGMGRQLEEYSCADVCVAVGTDTVHG